MYHRIQAHLFIDGGDFSPAAYPWCPTGLELTPQIAPFDESTLVNNAIQRCYEYETYRLPAGIRVSPFGFDIYFLYSFGNAP